MTKATAIIVNMTCMVTLIMLSKDSAGVVAAIGAVVMVALVNYADGVAAGRKV